MKGNIKGMGRVKLTIEGYKCERCEYEWIARKKKTEPRVCPKCKSPYWDVPKKNKGDKLEKPKVISHR